MVHFEDAAFVDHYAALGPDLKPGTPATELRRAYVTGLRTFHPDKRPTSSTGAGRRATVMLNEAWAVLGSPGRREAYDICWRHRSTLAEPAPSAPPDAWSRAAALRREGNDLFAEAQQVECGADIASAAFKYEAALAKYTEGLTLAPQQYQLWSNRALCQGRLKHWEGCRGDALQATRLAPESAKAWYWLAKATWRLEGAAAGQRALLAGLLALPGDAVLLSLHQDLGADMAWLAGSSAHLLPSRVRSFSARHFNFAEPPDCLDATDGESELPEMPAIMKPPAPKRPPRSSKVAKPPTMPDLTVATESPACCRGARRHSTPSPAWAAAAAAPSLQAAAWAQRRDVPRSAWREEPLMQPMSKRSASTVSCGTSSSGSSAASSKASSAPSSATLLSSAKGMAAWLWA